MTPEAFHRKERVAGSSPPEGFPANVVFDTVGGERLRRSRAVLRPGGRLVSVAAEPPDRGVYFIVEPNREELRSLARLVVGGNCVPRPSRSFPSLRRRRRSRGAWSEVGEARWRWQSLADVA